MKRFDGKALLLNRSDINTDEIIPARYLSEVAKEALKPHLFEDLKLKGFDHTRDLKNKEVIISKDNFGCGSSREHAVWAFEVNHINIVIAPGFARIFRQNMFNNGMIALSIDQKEIDHIFSTFTLKDVKVVTSLIENTVTLNAEESSETFELKLTAFERELIVNGGWLEFAEKNY